MGARPGDTDEVSNFILPGHESLSSKDVANAIAAHFASISSQFAPFNIDSLPKRVLDKMKEPESLSKIPVIEDFEIYQKIRKANKPKTGVPGDLPKRIVKEFAPELCTPIGLLFRSIIESASSGPVKWPDSWKLECGIPLPKTSDPKDMNDLRVISMTPFFSKVLESFVMDWLMEIIKDKLDPKQFGGRKGSSVSHYLIELVNYILYNQDFSEPVAILMCTIDFSKAFNLIDHNHIVTKLSDLGVPGWLLNVVSGFLINRTMVLKYNDTDSKEYAIQAGGPQGTLLGLLLFLILINACCSLDRNLAIGHDVTGNRSKFTPSTFYAKYVDDISIAESIDLRSSLRQSSTIVHPTPYHARLGLSLPSSTSKVFAELLKVREYAEANLMKLNLSKTNFMLFNPTTSYDFMPELDIDGVKIETVETMKILGVMVTSDLSWKKNT